MGNEQNTHTFEQSEDDTVSGVNRKHSDHNASGPLIIRVTNIVNVYLVCTMQHDTCTICLLYPKNLC